MLYQNRVGYFLNRPHIFKSVIGYTNNAEEPSMYENIAQNFGHLLDVKWTNNFSFCQLHLFGWQWEIISLTETFFFILKILNDFALFN